MSNRYSHLLSPLKIGNVLLKNRMLYSNALPHFLQGPETFPSEAILSYMGNVAKNGAAIVTFPNRPILPRTGTGDMPHTPMFDINDPSVQNYFSHLTDIVHFYDSKISIALNVEGHVTASEPGGYNISDLTEEDLKRPEMYGLHRRGKAITKKQIQEIIEIAAGFAKFYQSLGFDMVTLYASYRNSVLAHSLSPVINRRTDQYGGSVENRARLILEISRAIKYACGPDFLVEAQISGEEKAGGYTIEDTVGYTKVWEGAVDIIQLRALDGSLSHPTGFNSQRNIPINTALCPGH